MLEFYTHPLRLLALTTIMALLASPVLVMDQPDMLKKVEEASSNHMAVPEPLISTGTPRESVKKRGFPNICEESLSAAQLAVARLKAATALAIDPPVKEGMSVTQGLLYLTD